MEECLKCPLVWSANHQLLFGKAVAGLRTKAAGQQCSEAKHPLQLERLKETLSTKPLGRSLLAVSKRLMFCFGLLMVSSGSRWFMAFSCAFRDVVVFFRNISRVVFTF